MLSKPAIAMSNRPSTSPLISAIELGVNDSDTATPCAAKKPWRCAAQIGRFQPPSKAITRRGSRLPVAGAAPEEVAGLGSGMWDRSGSMEVGGGDARHARG